MKWHWCSARAVGKGPAFLTGLGWFSNHTHSSSGYSNTSLLRPSSGVGHHYQRTADGCFEDCNIRVKMKGKRSQRLLTGFPRVKHSAVWFCSCDLHRLPSYHAFCEKQGELQGGTVKSLWCVFAMPECVYAVLMALWQKRFLDIGSDDPAWDMHESHFSEIWPFYFHSWGEGGQSQTDLEGIIHQYQTVKLELHDHI